MTSTLPNRDLHPNLVHQAVPDEADTPATADCDHSLSQEGITSALSVSLISPGLGREGHGAAVPGSSDCGTS